MKKKIWLRILGFGAPILTFIFIVLLFIIQSTTEPIETNWSEVKSKMLANQDVERIVVVNEKQANIYIKKDRLNKYESEFSSNFLKYSESSPQFTFNIGSVETFERNLREAQEGMANEVLPEYKEERNWAGEIFWTGTPIVIIILLLIAYFIPTYIAFGKENQIFIILLNILVGWTILGWIGALAWAITSKKIKKNWIYICKNCNYQYNIDQKVNLFVCPNCKIENDVSGI